MAKSYYEKLRDPRWQKKRLEIMERENFTCQECGDSESTLNVHHGYYEKGYEPWEYPDQSLQCLCEACHEKVTAWRLFLNRQIGLLSFVEIQELFGFSQGMTMNDRHMRTTLYSHRHVIGIAKYFAIQNYDELDEIVSDVHAIKRKSDSVNCQQMTFAIELHEIRKSENAIRQVEETADA